MLSDKPRARSRRLTEEGAWIVCGQVASVLGALALVRVLTERLDPVQYGQLALGLSAASLVNQSIMGGVTAGIGRFYSIAVETNDVSGYMYATRRMLIAATLGVLLLAVVIITVLVKTGLTTWVGFAVVAYFLFSQGIITLSAQCRMQPVNVRLLLYMVPSTHG